MRRSLTVLLAALALSPVVRAEDAKPEPKPAPGADTPAPAPAKTGDPAKAAAPADPAAPRTLKQDASFQIGLKMADSIKAYDLDPVEVKQGIDAALSGTAKIDQAKFQTIMESYQKQMTSGQATRNKAFFDENAKKPTVKTTKSGLQYEVIASGAGKTPSANDTVSVNYKGTFPDGRVFDESASHGGPASFQVGGVIRGWTEALGMMKEGDKWRLYVPSELAYGENPPPGSGIPPSQILIFEVELLKILPPGSGPGGPQDGDPRDPRNQQRDPRGGPPGGDPRDPRNQQGDPRGDPRGGPPPGDPRNQGR